MTAKPTMTQRPGARVFVLDSQDRVLLFHFVFGEGYKVQRTFWGCPGGAKESHESYAQAAQRELLEETGFDTPVGAEVFRRLSHFPLPDGEWVEADERFFLVRTDSKEIDRSGHIGYEKTVLQQARWWSIEELQATEETVFPEGLPEILSNLLK
ncbi:NUDIX domain-containing protein [Rhodobacteraceae bacterium RKSG542]|uniref:NUDIX hydrolase n=1 Tax=Pseudovibrio flavus TaxID=2529854 RepID=UPI0012BC5CB6|nr:NUDIX domain-containing protein [Pseudovibrio flavus]MTI17807.1 NUDIX domain-containing protein [Pseudovibrio flavus]